MATRIAVLLCLTGCASEPSSSDDESRAANVELVRGTIAMGGVVEGDLERGGPGHAWSFEANADDEITLEIKGRGSSPFLSPQLRLFGPAAAPAVREQIDQDMGSGFRQLPRLNRTITVSGTYRVLVETTWGDGGHYRLSLTCESGACHAAGTCAPRLSGSIRACLLEAGIRTDSPSAAVAAGLRECTSDDRAARTFEEHCGSNRPHEPLPYCDAGLDSFLDRALPLCHEEVAARFGLPDLQLRATELPPELVDLIARARVCDSCRVEAEQLFYEGPPLPQLSTVLWAKVRQLEGGESKWSPAGPLRPEVMNERLRSENLGDWLATVRHLSGATESGIGSIRSADTTMWLVHFPAPPRVYTISISETD